MSFGQNIEGKNEPYPLNEYDMQCLWIDIAVLCDAWLILAFIFLLSRQLTPWHFFPGFELIEDRTRHVHCNRVLRLGQ